MRDLVTSLVGLSRECYFLFCKNISFDMESYWSSLVDPFVGGSRRFHSSLFVPRVLLTLYHDELVQQTFIRGAALIFSARRASPTKISTTLRMTDRRIIKIGIVL